MARDAEKMVNKNHTFFCMKTIRTHYCWVYPFHFRLFIYNLVMMEVLKIIGTLFYPDIAKPKERK